MTTARKLVPALVGSALAVALAALGATTWLDHRTTWVRAEQDLDQRTLLVAKHIRYTTDEIDKALRDPNRLLLLSIPRQRVNLRGFQATPRVLGHECPSARRGAAVKPRSRAAVRLRRRA